MEHNTAKNFALQLGALATLYISLGSFIALTFSLISILFPDEADGYWYYESATSTIRFSIAMLVVFFPTYLWLTRTVQQIRRSESGSYLSLTRWLIYLSLLVGGGILLGDAVAVLYGFLEGELTIRFFLKALVLALITGLAFYYYLRDAQGYWQDQEKQSQIYGFLVTLIVAGAVGLGVYFMEPPSMVREMRIDENQVGDLQNIYWQIDSYYMNNQALPGDLTTAFSPSEPPVAPTERANYQYTVESETSFTLCAEFAHDSQGLTTERWSGWDRNFDWTYEAGDWCFERTVEKITFE